MRKYKISFGQYLKPDLWLSKALENIPLRHAFLTFMRVIIIWPAIISVSNVNIILLPLEQKVPTAYRLQHLLSKNISISAGNSTSVSWIVKVWSISLGTNLKRFYIRVLLI